MFSVGKPGQAAEVEVLTIRYYEQFGLLPEDERSRTTSGSTGSKAFERLHLFATPASWAVRWKPSARSRCGSWRSRRGSRRQEPSPLITRSANK